ncbi:MAG TPA: hypothetical protein VG937_00645 [Polyangiaceae bacterium]|nr:hypothetical protein [Polyangiaceae bacterium]
MKSTQYDDSPRAVQGLDLRALPLSPLEARVLSRVDGVCTCTEIGTSVGLSYAEVMQILGRLASLGAVRFDGRSTSLAERATPSAHARSGEYRLEQPANRGSDPARPSASQPAATSSVPPRSSPSALGSAEEIAERKRALARKLGHSSLPPTRPPSSPSVPAASSRGAYEVGSQLQHYVGLADAAAEKQDWVSACNFLRLACSLAPRDLALADRLKALELRAASELWEKYAERGRREELLGEWALAARSYERAALGHTSSELLERVAFCILQAKGDLKRAGEFAKRAAALSPQSIRCSLTLLRYYASARLIPEARAELDRARMLAPELPEVRDWTRRATTGDW